MEQHCTPCHCQYTHRLYCNGPELSVCVMQKNVQYNAMHAVLASNAFDGRKILKKVTKGTWTNKGCTIDPCSVANASGIAFTTLRRMEGSTQGFGNGFVLARYV